MRVQRIRVRDFKGVGDLELELSTEGVTIVEGPNEVGKTTITEALVLALEQPDSSTRAEVRAARPVHVDAGPSVEVELTTGGYHLVVTKRWLKSPATHLRVTAPRAEELTGRQAHERLRAILAETLDEQLFRALHWEQGLQIRQVAVGHCPSLAAALEASASGQLLAGRNETTLLELVEGERLRYFTSTGRVGAERAARARAIESLRDEAETAQAALDELDAMADEHHDLAERLAELRAEHDEAELSLRREAENWATVGEQQLHVRERVLAARAAADDKAEAARRRDDRAALEAAARQAAGALAVEVEALGRRRAEVEPAERAAAAAAGRRDAARAAARQAAADEERARGAAELADARISLDLWRQRRDRVAAARRHQAEAEGVLAANRLDGTRLEAIERAALVANEARVRLATASATVTVEALSVVTVRGGGDARPLRPGESWTLAVHGRSVIELGETARVVVTGGASEQELVAALEQAVTTFDSLVEEAGLEQGATVAACRLAAQQRREATAAVSQARQLLEDNLRDLSMEQLEAKVAHYGSLLDEQSAPGGGAAEAASPDADAVRATLGNARSARERAEQDLDDAEQSLETARAQQSVLGGALQAQRGRHEVSRCRQLDALAALELARRDVPDEELDRRLARAGAARLDAEAELTEAERCLALLDPESVQARLENAQALVHRLNREINDAERRLAGLGAVLAARGEEGLGGRLEALGCELEARLREHQRVEAAAAAVELLWRTLTAQRDSAQRAYVAPYRTALERLGRIAYGPDFAVDVDHATLTIESRTLAGRTVAYDQLSTGAREQLSIIAMLACAAIVTTSDGGGAPVIIDDALGSSDRQRLERLGPAIAAASAGCQVVILTCEPARYRSVGNALVRHLR